MNTTKRILSTIGLACGLILGLVAAPSKAQQVISFQGSAASNGVNLSGSHAIELAIYENATGGTALWKEAQSAVTFTDGSFDVLLGSNTSNPLPIFDAGSYDGAKRLAPSYFLGISIDGGTELSPRSQLGAAPTAWSARFADSARIAGAAITALNGLPSGAIIMFGDSSSHPGYSFTGYGATIGPPWTTGAALPVGQSSMVSAVVNGKIYVLGGYNDNSSNNQIYDPVASMWSSGAALINGQNRAAAAAVSGKIYVIGGEYGGQNDNQIYDPFTDTWSAGAVLPVAQYSPVSEVVNGKIYVIGGVNGTGANNQIYDPIANKWSTGAPLPVGQHDMVSAVVNGKIYVIGGSNGSSNYNQIYDPVANKWSTGAPLPVAQHEMTSAVLNGKIYVIGGSNGNRNDNQIYDPVANKWSSGPVFPVGTNWLTSAAVNGKIYVIGGAGGSGNNNYIYTPGLTLYYFTKD